MMQSLLKNILTLELLLIQLKAWSFQLLKIVKGPDFPTGGDIEISNDNLKNIYNKGRGSLVIKSKSFKSK